MKNNKKMKFSPVNNDKLHKNLDFVSTEQYKLLRTNLIFTLPANVKCPIVGITSSTRGEGKSTTAINLSYVIAENGSKVLLIDGDLRIPSIAKRMEIKNTQGLTDLLVNPEFNTEDLKSPLNKNWYILPSGKIPPNPSELLASERMGELLAKLREEFDYIIIDLPPVNLVSDAISISPLIEGMILVIREDYVTKKDLELCYRQFELSKVKLFGCVMNDSMNGANFYGRYGKYRKSNKYKYYKYYRYKSYESNSEDRSK